MQLFTPRKPKSVWAATNKKRVEKLVAAMTIPEDFLRALKKTAGAKRPETRAKRIAFLVEGAAAGRKPFE